MKIALFNWAPAYTNEGGGVTVYLKNIVNALAAKGHDVTVLSSGFYYDFDRNDVYSDYQIARSNNVKYVDIVNSRVLAPSFYMFHNIEKTIFEESTEQAVRQFFIEHGPFDVFHIQNIEGIPWRILNLKKEFPRTSFIISHHNYHAICQQVHLFYNDASVCENYYSGIACYSCRASEPNYPQTFFERYLHTRKKQGETADMNDVTFLKTNAEKLTNQWLDPYKINDKAFDIKSMQLYGENKFAFRRHEAVRLMNENCDYILSVSKYVSEKMISTGVSGLKSIVSYIGSNLYNKNINITHAKKTPGKIRLAFIGYANQHKGFHFLLNAFARMPKSLHGKMDFTFAGRVESQNDVACLNLLRNIFSDVKILTGYTHAELAHILSDVDIGIVPPIWGDALPQVAIEFLCHGTPIFVSDTGGQKEIINHPGFVFKSGDIDSFWEKLSNILADDDSLRKFWDAGVKLFSVEDHVAELINIYTRPASAKPIGLTPLTYR